MRATRWILAVAAGLLIFSGGRGVAQGNGHGKGHAKHNEDDDQGYYRDHDRDEVRGWYHANQSNLPPGLAKKDRLPPGLEKQLVHRGTTLPPGLQRRLQPCPEELERRLPPPPPDCAHVLVGGHLVLLNRRTNIVVDIIHFEVR